MMRGRRGGGQQGWGDRRGRWGVGDREGDDGEGNNGVGRWGGGNRKGETGKLANGRGRRRARGGGISQMDRNAWVGIWNTWVEQDYGVF